MYHEKEIHSFEINYITEGKYGVKLDIMKKEIEDNKFILEMKDGEKVICSSRAIWRDLN